MSSPAAPFDRRLVRLRRDRAASTVDRVAAVFHHAADLLLDRLQDTVVRFEHALDIGGRGFIAPRLQAQGITTICCDLSTPMVRRNAAAGLCVTADEEYLPFKPASFDLIIASLSLHWVNDLPGALIQIRRALKPGGLFLASLPALGTLAELRDALTAAELAVSGGASPRLSPLAALGDLAGLLQRAGFSLPVADITPISLAYRNTFQILRDLRDAGETNATHARSRRPPPLGLFSAALARIPETKNQTQVTIQMAILTGWSPAPPTGHPHAASRSVIPSILSP